MKRSWIEILTSFDGRISRLTWWIAQSVLYGLLTLFHIFIAPMVMDNPFELVSATQGNFSARIAQYSAPGYLENLMWASSMQQILEFGVIVLPTTALMVQRFNDRERPSWLAWLFWIPTFTQIGLNFFGLSWTRGEAIGGLRIPMMTSTMTIVNYVAIIVSVWAIFELGFLRGTEGPNRFGSDPAA